MRGATSTGWLEPAPDLEEYDEKDEREHLRADSKYVECGRCLYVLHHEREVLAEKSGDEGERHEDSRDNGQLFDDFVLAIAFVNRVAELAERENHHPDIEIHYKRVILRWWTHTAGGVTDRDRELAEQSAALA